MEYTIPNQYWIGSVNIKPRANQEFWLFNPDTEKSPLLEDLETDEPVPVYMFRSKAQAERFQRKKSKEAGSASLIGELLSPMPKKQWKRYSYTCTHEGRLCPAVQFSSMEQARAHQRDKTLEIMGEHKNAFTVDQNTVTMKMDWDGHDPVYVKFDLEDLQTILDHGTWWCGNQSQYKQYALANAKKASASRSAKIYMHHLVLPLPDPNPNDLTVDHINRDTLDNRRCNLRLATRRTQSLNREKLKKSATQLVGLSLHTKQSKCPDGHWEATFSYSKDTASAHISRSRTKYGIDLSFELAKTARVLMEACESKQQFDAEWPNVEKRLLKEHNFHEPLEGVTWNKQVQGWRARKKHPYKGGKKNASFHTTRKFMASLYGGSDNAKKLATAAREDMELFTDADKWRDAWDSQRKLAKFMRDFNIQKT